MSYSAFAQSCLESKIEIGTFVIRVGTFVQKVDVIKEDICKIKMMANMISIRLKQFI